LGAIILPALSREMLPTFVKANNNSAGKTEIDESRIFHQQVHCCRKMLGFNPVRFWKQILSGVTRWAIIAFISWIA
jgi:chromate transporter